MRRRTLLTVAGALTALAGLAFAQEEQGRQAPRRMELSIRGGGAQDPAQAGAAALGARQAEVAAAEAEAQIQEERGRERARQLSQEALRQGDAPLTRFGVLSGPLAPTRLPPVNRR